MKNENLRIIELSNLHSICDGDRVKEIRYLKQFITLIPGRIKLLRKAMKEDNFIKIRREVHKMSPQAEFFGIRQVVKLKNILEIEQEIYSEEELKTLISDIIIILESATNEIRFLLTNEFNQSTE